MRGRSLLGAVLVLLWSFMGQASGQEEASTSPLSPAERASQEIEFAIADLERVGNPNEFISLSARAANLLWLRDAERARMMFRELWRRIEESRDASLNSEASRLEILKNLFPRDPALAREYLDGLAGGRRSEDASIHDQVSGADPSLNRLARLSMGLADHDTSMAASLLERSLSVSVSPAALISLTHLRSKDSHLSDYVVSRTMENLRQRPTVIALTGMYLLIDYLFPTGTVQNRTPAKLRDASLHAQYFSVAYDTLRRSLEEREPLLKEAGVYSESDLRLRSAYIGQMAAVLSVLASRFAPALASDLKAISTGHAGAVPPAVAQVARFTVARLGGEEEEPGDPESVFSTALARGELDEARNVVEAMDDPNRRKALSQALARVEFTNALGRMELVEALMIARRIEDAALRSSLLALAARAAFQKREIEFSKMILYEARSGLLESGRGGVRVWMLFSLASEAAGISPTMAMETLESAVGALNALHADASKQKQGESLADEVNPRYLLRVAEFENAFATAGALDLEAALLSATQLEDDALRLAARLASCAEVLNRQAGREDMDSD